MSSGLRGQTATSLWQRRSDFSVNTTIINIQRATTVIHSYPGPSPSLTHKLFSSCIRRSRYLVSRDCDWVMPALSAVAENLGNPLSGAQRTAQLKNFELILTLKVETRHPVGWPFGREFSAFVIIAELWQPEVARRGFCEQFLRFVLKKRPLSNCHYCADRAQNLPGPAFHIWLTLFQISSKSVHFRWSYCRTREDRFCPVKYLQYRLFEPIITTTKQDGAKRQLVIVSQKDARQCTNTFKVWWNFYEDFITK